MTEDKAVTSNAKTGMVLESYEVSIETEKRSAVVNITYFEEALDAEIAKLLEMQTLVINKIKKILNGKNGEIRTTEDVNNE